MGTDITMLVEGRHHGRWTPLIGKAMWPDEVNRRLGSTPVLVRNYELFSMLADVRNRSGRGTKQLRTIADPSGGPDVEWIYDTDDGGHDPLIPISNPKGVPDDASQVWKDWLNEPQNDIVYHDPSFLTLEELRTGQWDQVVYRDAVLTEEEYIALRDHGVQPTSLARGIGGVGALTVNEVEYAAGKRGENVTGVNTRWRAGTVRDNTKTFMVMMTAFEGAAEEVLGGADNIRILFAFDS